MGTVNKGCDARLPNRSFTCTVAEKNLSLTLLAPVSKKAPNSSHGSVAIR